MREGAYERERAVYGVRFEKALVITLGCTILMFGLFRRVPRDGPRERRIVAFSTTTLDMVPITSHGGIPRPPNLPQVPIPTEDEYLPEDETIEVTKLDLMEGIPVFEGDGSGEVRSGLGAMGARPVRDVLPEYPEEERREGVEGVVELAILVNPAGEVDSVRVLRNTTQSRRLERAAVQAAYKSRYLPEQKDGKGVFRWIRRPYRFESQ